jgi:hypothetical protein
MSQPDPPIPPPVPPPPPVDPAAPEVPVDVAPPVPSGPYRLVAAPAPQEHAITASPRPWPVIGPVLSVYAVLLWSFVVFGQFTTSWSMGTPMSPQTAALAVLLLTFVSWLVAFRRSRIAAPPRARSRLVGRAIGIPALACACFLTTIIAATIVGNESSRDHDVLIAFVLVCLSGLAALAGPRLTSPMPSGRSHQVRFAYVATWIAGVLVTLVAGASLVANG